ncbi:MAG: CpsD/CapB family tyrosine-protein kinase [Anaerolineaceae bacterium]|nr:CpsD/CapB family tyrosine-protein kinase [Anaerolineaceae bacterium]MCB9099390.1 CpsD/CapB family tyrosine-protein kinase [Anaerolineales bacterium]
MPSNAIITLTDPRSTAAEAYRTLRTNIEFSSVDEPLRTLLVTSSAPSDDKSAIVANLAVALADGERRIILVDADLRRPAQHTLFELSNERGFTSLFKDDSALNAPPLQPVPNTTLQVLTSGPLPPIPSQLLASKKISDVLARLSEMAEMVIFDAPPIITVNDASLLASKVDGVLLAVRAGGTKREHVKAAKDRLEKVNARLIGAVLTNAHTDLALQYS